MPQVGGAIKSWTGIAGYGNIPAAPLTGMGNFLATVDLPLGQITYANLAKGMNIGATIDDNLGELYNADMRGKALLNLLVRIGSSPSAEDIVFAMMDTSTGSIESSMTLRQAMKVLLAVAAGKTDITDLGGGSASVKFRDVGDSKDVVTASMTGSERTTVTLDKS